MFILELLKFTEVWNALFDLIQEFAGPETSSNEFVLKYSQKKGKDRAQLS